MVRASCHVLIGVGALDLIRKLANAANVTHRATAITTGGQRKDMTYQIEYRRSRRESNPEPLGLRAQHVGARAGSRTLNLGIKRRLTFLARKRQDGSWRASRIRRYDAIVSQSVLTCHRLPRVSCQISCQFQQVSARLTAKLSIKLSERKL